ncbi:MULTISPECIES: flagellar hook assembly protein FlgD [Variovorax]|jgi:flagellar basal-body rod modification protein FlgD|uniref:flagellar hook assembly protein FlgD n=1 Tax=Variovorax TaxID=34072 RepID=UPI00086A34B0|nr:MULTISPECIES: flagellar hook assembly protein FlgD [Variovorax]MBN8757262.1 flagellar hook assembly protein FlgD [Variovorax sp.]ODU13765.1 MAG: flagellar biosynthesis protein FlgD [Variovorax sp. SCN 67-85]ODV20696.1 MAG: flagellar biosynthesis protein FlgD [Variovorax sp. SCN 67-20]OJZ13671.1 MAG: flagellar biosynthesis protein FlgD [Variovorax sp. 67-131]UKI06326.1 flagellar hook assembly protein FlgD [Variovorax paradoxus]
MAISDTSSISGQNASSATGNTVSSQDNEQRFLKLLVTQLNNQDPLNPMQNAELTSQLAQMSTVTGIEKLNTTLSGLVNQTGANQLLQATSLIGYNVLSPGDILTTKKPDEGKDPATQAFGVELPGTAADVTIKIVDDKGNVVRTIDAGPMKEGVNAVTWDGKDEAGNAVAAGAYRFTVDAKNGSAAVTSTALTFSQVAAVKQGAGGVTLELGSGNNISLSDVRLFL